MNSKKNIIISTDDYLLSVFKIIWKEKIIVVFTAAIFILVAYFYSISKPVKLISQIVINTPPVDLFNKYEIERKNYVSTQDNLKMKNINTYFETVKKNILSADNFSQFINDNKIFENFINYCKSKNISEKSFFKDNFKELKIRNVTIENTYVLEYHNQIGVDGQLLLNKYIEFTVKKILENYKQRLKNSILNEISSLRLAYSVAEIIGLENPANQISSLNSNHTISTSGDMYTLGTKGISKYILNYEKLIDELQKEKLNYKYILDSASIPLIVNVATYLYVFIGLILGLIFSIVIILVFKK